MRITQRMMSRGYINRMHGNLSNLAGSNQRLASGVKYNRISDNTSEVSRAFAVREQLYKNEQHMSNIKGAESELSAAESNLQIVNTLMRNVEDRLLQANTGTMGENERQIIAREIGSLQDQILQVSNASFGEKHLFAGSGTGAAPFSVDPNNGKLLYNGYDVDALETNPATGNPAFRDPTSTPPNELVDMKYNKDVYLDVGLGLSVSGTGTPGVALDPRSALKISTSGVDAFGYGTNAGGMPNNVYSLLGKIIGDVKNGNMDEMGKDLSQIKKGYDQLLMNITDVGTRSSFLDETLSRLDSDNINLKTTQQRLETVQLDEESIYNKSYEMSWMVTLQLGSKIIPPSIFDFIR